MIHAAKIFLPLILTIVFFSTGCGSSDEPEQSARTPSVTIAMLSIPNDESIARSWYHSVLEQELGVKVITLNYDSGMLANNAMTTDNVDIAIVGTAAAAIGISKGLPYEIFWIHSIDGENESLAVKNDSGINSIAELKGKRVGVPPASTAQYSLLNAIKLAGLSENDVAIIYTQPSEIVRNWRDGKLDAAFVWQPYLGDLLDDGHILVSSRVLNKEGLSTADIGIVNKKFAQEHPEVVEKYIELQSRAYKVYTLKPDIALESAATNLGITLEEAREQMREIVWLSLEDQLTDEYLGTSERKGQMVDTLLSTAKFFAEHEIIKSATKRDTFERAVNPAYIEAVVKRQNQ